MATLGGRIKQLRLNHGMTQDELAAYIGVTKASVSNYERGQRNPPYAVLRSIAETFGISASELLAYMDTEEDGAENMRRPLPVGSELPRQMKRLSAAFFELSDVGREKAIERVEELGQIPMYQRTLVNVLQQYIYDRYHLSYALLEETDERKTSGDNTASGGQGLEWNVRHIILQRLVRPDASRYWDFFYFSFDRVVSDDFDIGQILAGLDLAKGPGYNLAFVFDEESLCYRFYNWYVQQAGIRGPDAGWHDAQALFLYVEKNDLEIKDAIEYDPNM